MEIGCAAVTVENRLGTAYRLGRYIGLRSHVLCRN